jgi:hypothetical protein
MRATGRWAVASALVVLTAYWLLSALKAYAAVRNVFPWDIVVDWGGAKALYDGIDPYSPLASTRAGLAPHLGLAHPPTAFVWFLPLAQIDVMSVKEIWNTFTIFLLLVYVFLLAYIQRWPWAFLCAAAVFAATLAASWMTLHFYVVSLSTLIAFLCLWSYVHLERGEDLVAGLLLGAALTMKFYPAVIVVGLLFLKRYRVAIGAALGWLVFAIPVTLKVGITGWRNFLQDTGPYLLRWMWHIRNASIQGIVQRFAYPVCENVPENPQNLPPWRAGQWLATGISLALIAVSIWAARRFFRRTGRVDIPVALFTVIALNTGPYTWEHYRVTLLFPLAVLIVECLRELRPSMRAIVAGATLVSIWLLWQDVHEPEFVWTKWRNLPHTAALHFELHRVEVQNWLPYWLLTGALLMLLFASRQPTISSAAPGKS